MALANLVTETSYLTTIYLLAGAYLALCCLRAWRDPLRSISGPFMGRFTVLWQLKQVRKRRWHKQLCEIHDTYSSNIVRLAPNQYSINDPSAVKTIYGHGSKFAKTRFYQGFGHPDLDKKDLFSEMNSDKHAADKRKVSSLYSMTSLVSYEPFVDNVNEELCEVLAEKARAQERLPILRWMQLYAFDVIGHITVAQPFGFLRNGGADDQILHAIHKMTVTGSQVGLVPWVIPPTFFIAEFFKLPLPNFVIGEYIKHHLIARKTGKTSSDANDFLSKLLDLRKGEKLKEIDVQLSIGSNIAAGSDTTAIGLSSIIYHLCQHPKAAAKLRQEIDDMSAAGLISDPVTFQEASKMPYLQVVIKEALRKHPVVDTPLWRVVPNGGATIAGTFFPEGTQVGVGAWPLHYNTDVFGPDAAEFRPERWLEESSASLEKYFLTFGAGARTCIGKNISLLELNKVIPQIYRRFDFSLCEPSKEIDIVSGWFAKPHFDCYVKLR